jgi:hypothetical protein
VHRGEAAVVYKCRKCELETGFGCLPTSTCGVYFMGLIAVSVWGVVVVVQWLRGHAGGGF